MNLSPRQRDVMRLVADGEPNKVIARELGIGECSVRTHLNILFKRAGAKNRAHAVAMFVRDEITKGKL